VGDEIRRRAMTHWNPKPYCIYPKFHLRDDVESYASFEDACVELFKKERGPDGTLLWELSYQTEFGFCYRGSTPRYWKGVFALGSSNAALFERLYNEGKTND
jgi:hypothetical protein